VASSQTVNGATVYSLHVPKPERYYLLWITRLAPDGDRFQTHVSEVSTASLAAPAPSAASTVSQQSSTLAPPSPSPAPTHGKGRGRGKHEK
jgi:hypothetical protein